MAEGMDTSQKKLVTCKCTRKSCFVLPEPAAALKAPLLHPADFVQQFHAV